MEVDRPAVFDEADGVLTEAANKRSTVSGGCFTRLPERGRVGFAPEIVATRDKDLSLIHI